MSGRFHVEHQVDVFRVMDRQTGMPAINERTQNPMDAGGHGDIDKAERQAAHLNEWWTKKEADLRGQGDAQRNGAQETA